MNRESILPESPNDDPPCELHARGWTSSVESGPGFVMVMPCPACGCIHRRRPAHQPKGPLS